jgi:predicted permease
MNAASRSVAEGHSRLTLGKALAGAQVALSLVLLVAAGLLVESLRKLSNEDPGFRADGVLLVTADLRRSGVPNEQLASVSAKLLEALRAIPGVVDASQSQIVPVSGDRWNDVIAVDGYTPKDPDDAQIWFNRVSPRYFATLETRLLAGRDFNAGDVSTAPRVAIVNDAFTRRFFGTANAVGRQFRTRVGDTLSAPLTVVGVVENSKYESLWENPGPIAYVAMSQGTPRPAMTAELRSAGDPAALVPAVRLAVARVNPRIVLELETLTNQLSWSISRERLLAVLSALFGAVALSLATLGLYGVMAYSVARRTNEFGVRQALGADRARIIGLMLGDVGRVVFAGTIVGVTGAAGIGKLLSSFLFRTQPVEPAVLASAAALLAVVAVAAGFVPALRASRVDPVAALRE